MSEAGIEIAWRIPLTEEPGGLHDPSGYRVRHD